MAPAFRFRISLALTVSGLVGLLSAGQASWGQEAPLQTVKPRVIPLDFAVAADSQGGIVTADLNGDGQWDFVVTAPGNIGAYRHDGKRLWHVKAPIRVSAGSSESTGLPGHHAPGVQVGDVDGDKRAELLYLDQSDTVHFLDAATGKEERAVRIPHPEGAERWEHLVIVNLRGKGDVDLLLQATVARGYRYGRFVSAYAIDKLDGEPLWKTDRFGALAHGPLRAADLDGDGRDEICGYTILGPDGKQTEWRYPPRDPKYGGGRSYHIDSLFIYDTRPDVPGLEVVLLEEGRNYVGVVNLERGLVWWETNRQQEPQNAAVGEFDLTRPGLEVWCRSRYNTHQKPWVFDARGKLISAYEMDDVAPPGWTDSGVEVINPIHWTGEKTQLAAAKERHRSGDVGIFEPISGKFVARFKDQADRIYVADVSGDWREEVIVVSGKEIHIYENPAKNPRPRQPRLWRQQHYRRAKMSWNYYSP